MIKADIVRKLGSQMNMKDKDALLIVDQILESMKEVIKEYGRLEVRDFGVFQVKTRKPRVGRNPKDKKEYPIPPRSVVTFKPGKELKAGSVVEEDGEPAEGEPAPPVAKSPVSPSE
jgi:nucleoid DNA-binding protein